MDLKTLEPRLGNWLSIGELKGFLTELPEEMCHRIPINQKLLNMASEFVEEKRGSWEHGDWESFLARLSRERFFISEDVKPPIGNILEIFKKYYNNNMFKTIMEKREHRETPVLRAVSSRQAPPAKRQRN